MGTSQATNSADSADASLAHKEVLERPAAGQAFSGRPTTVRFSTDLQKKLAVASKITEMSVSELMREGAEYVVAKYLGADNTAVAETIRAATEADAKRMRELYGLTEAS